MLMAVLVAGWFLLPITGLSLSVPGDGGALATRDSTRIPWRVMRDSITVAVAVGGLATGIGLGFAVLLGLTDLRGGPVWMTLLMVPFACPATVWALAQTYAYGPGGVVESFGGSAYRFLFGQSRSHYLAAVLILTQIHVPLTTLLIARGLGRLPNAGFEAARFFLRPAPLIVWMLRVIAVELGAAFLLASCLAFTNFAVPHVVQCRLYPVEIYLRLSNYLDHAGAARMALPMLFVSLVATALVTWLLAPASPLP